MSNTNTKALGKKTDKAEKKPAPAVVPNINVIVEKTYRMAETLKNVRLPGE